MALRRKGEEEEAGPRWLEVNASMTGTLSFKDPVNLQMNGQFDGTLDIKGSLSIGEKALVKATIRGEVISIAGSVEGEVSASGRLELLGTARVVGKLTAPRLVVHDGAIFQGACQMLKPEGGSSFMTLEELARYLEVEERTVLDWAQSGRLPAQRDGTQWRFDRRRVEEWLAQEKIK
ncbi:MAG: polymer-forming cytoskeletal protein [Candidatus Omnitrophica bacterium]|nr:polymer-forming cytoskeletal protein [Candidatus Omnitrophota bacterium]